MPKKIIKLKITKRTGKKVVKKKAVKKKVVKKKVVKKKIIKPIQVPDVKERKQIFLSSYVYGILVNHLFQNRSGHPHVFLLGEDNRQIVRALEKIDDNSDGCGEMPDLSPTSLANGYVTLAKKNLVPIGLARTAGSFDSDGEWRDSCGPAIYANIGYILTVANGVINGKVFVPWSKKSRVGMSRDSNDYYSGTIKNITVGVTDK